MNCQAATKAVSLNVTNLTLLKVCMHVVAATETLSLVVAQEQSMPYAELPRKLGCT